MRSFKPIAIAALLIGLSITATVDADDRLMKKLTPFFNQHCLRCHGPEAENGGLRIDELSGSLDDFASLDHFQNILDEITTGSMPPESEPQPSENELIGVSKILRSYIASAKKKHESGGGKRLRRLTRTEFVNTIEDLLGVHVDEDRLPADGATGKFETDVTGLYTTDMHLESYLEASRDAVKRFIASRNLKPGFEIIPTQYASSIAIGDLDIRATEVPPAGHLMVRMVVWQREPKPSNRIYIGPSNNTASYEVTGTPDEPQTIDIKIDQPANVVSWRFQSEISNIASTQAKKMSVGERRRAAKRSKVNQRNLLAIQQSFKIHPMVLGEIKNARYVSPQPSNFFKSVAGQNPPPDEAAKKIIRMFVEMINRGRPVDSEFVNRLNQIFVSGRRNGEPFWEAIVEPLAVSLCSVESLFHLELNASTDDANVSGIEFANRLSFFLWRSAPDEELLSLGKSNKLLAAQVKAKQIDRMMGDKRFKRFLNDFTDQWFELERQDLIAVDNRLYDSFEEELKPAMKQETVEFVSHLIRKNLPLKNLIDSDFMILNSQTANFYGIPNVRGSEFRKVAKRPADAKRGGILTQAGILMQTGTGDRTSIVERGAFVSRKLLGVDPPPPPPNVDALPTEGGSFAKMTAGQLVRAHLSAPQCASCHNNIDPLGMGLEEFDAVGLERSVERRLDPNAKRKRNRVFEVPIETAGRLPNGKKYQGVDGLKKALLSNEKSLAESFVKALLSYANGRTSGAADEAIVKKIVNQASEYDYPTFSIIKAVLYSDSLDSK